MPDDVLAQLLPGQHCWRCGRTPDRHDFTPLGAVRCRDLPADAGPGW
jgi:hypothetical protein